MITWRPHIKRTATKTLGTYIRIFYLYRFEYLSTNIKLTLYKALFKSIMVYASPAWEYAKDAHLSKLQNRVLRAICKLDRSISVPN
jgi:hypothetical protein